MSMEPYYKLVTLEELCNTDAADDLPVIRSDNGMSIGDLNSYRGYYDQLAFEPSKEIRTFGNVVDVAKSAIGKTFIGWKGGEFQMTKNTPLWVSAGGHVSHNAIVGIKIKRDKLVLVVKKVYG